MILTPLQDTIYRKGALDFKDLVIKTLEKQYIKADVHDEFHTEKTKIYLKSLENAIAAIKNLNASQALGEEEK